MFRSWSNRSPLKQRTLGRAVLLSFVLLVLDSRAELPRIDLAVPLAEVYLTKARLEGDSQWVVQAKSVLQPWWNLPEPPVEVLLLRASIRQNQHEFDRALADLDLLLRERPEDARAHLLKLSVLQVQGDYSEAENVLGKLEGQVSPLVYATARRGLASLQGEATESFVALRDELRATRASREERNWAWCVLGEMALRLGKGPAARESLESARRYGPLPTSLLCDYADLLLAEGLPEPVLELLRDRDTPDVLVRRIEAWRMSGGQQERIADATRRLERELKVIGSSRFAPSGSDRERALYHLRVEKDPVAALEAALKNWQTQKEPVDALLVVRAAREGGRLESAEPVLKWLERTGLEDVRIANALSAQ